MSLSNAQLELLTKSGFNLKDVKEIALLIESDYTVKGIFPDALDHNFSNPDIEKFKDKWCAWWPVAKILLTIAKVFTKEVGDKVIDALLKLGDELCEAK